jgi:hypothetical protein
MFLSLEKIVHLSQSMLFGEPVDDHQVKTTFTGNVPFDAKENLSSDVFRSWRIPSKRGGSTVQRFNPSHIFVRQLRSSFRISRTSTMIGHHQSD